MDLKTGYANQILKIQIDTVEAAQTLVDVDVRIARTQIGNAEIDRQSIKLITDSN